MPYKGFCDHGIDCVMDGLMHFIVVVSKGSEFIFWGWSLYECYECLWS
jgi:hypothetical protein